MTDVDKGFLRDAAAAAQLSLSDLELSQLEELAEPLLPAVDTVMNIRTPDISPAPGYRQVRAMAGPEDDPLGAVIRWCDVRQPDAESTLNHLRVGVKDAYSIAGVPLSCGSTLLDGFTPREDSVVVERVLAQGATIVATLNLDSWLFSSGAETSDFGVIRNPFDTRRTAGGSSGGSAAALFYDDVDVTLGTDQGGSIRVPASWCGVLGLKPTHSLVPYTGIVSGDASFDHAGPLARNVTDLASMLSAIAGAHPSDPRQSPTITSNDYVGEVEAVQGSFDSLRIGVLTEGFAYDEAAPPGTGETMDAVRDVLDELAIDGCSLHEISIPEHIWSGDLMLTGLFEGLSATFANFGNGYHWKGRYDEERNQFLGRVWSERSGLLPMNVKVALLLGQYFRVQHHGGLYAHMQSARQALSDAYDRAFRDVDLILMPTATHYAHEHAPDATPAERVLRGWSMVGNTGAANLTGHPALSIPSAEADGLPVGLMAVAPHFRDDLLLQFARAWEQVHGWRPTDLPKFGPEAQP